MFEDRMDNNFDQWGNLKGEPIRIVEEHHGDNFIRIYIHEANGLFAYGFQLKMGTVIRQTPANIGGAIFASEKMARIAASKEVEAVCSSNKNSKKIFSEFQNILHCGYSLFDGIL